jgi:hypothetical protein
MSFNAKSTDTLFKLAPPRRIIIPSVVFGAIQPRKPVGPNPNPGIVLAPAPPWRIKKPSARSGLGTAWGTLSNAGEKLSPAPRDPKERGPEAVVLLAEIVTKLNVFTPAGKATAYRA